MPKKSASGITTDSISAPIAAVPLAASVQTPPPPQASSPAPTDAALAAAAASAVDPTRIRGPVEEVIAKRVKQLSKKIQRFKGYAAYPSDKLNADQRAAVAQLPILEAQSRELEDLIKPGGQVELVELNEAAKLRSAKEDATKDAQGGADGKAEESLTTLSTNISLFLRLHALLHPSRTDDTHSLTFAPLDLPSQLQDEVQPTDILRVGRMHTDLLNGGDGTRAVVGVLSGSSSAASDEEDQHILHLLQLLAQPSQPTQETSFPPTRAESVAPEAETEGAANAEQIVTAPQSDAGATSHDLPNGHAEEPTEVVQPASRAESASGPAAGSGSGLNFLQADELQPISSSAREPQAAGQASEAQAPSESQPQRQRGVSEAREEGYEVVPPMQAHETAEYEPTPAVTEAAEPTAPAAAPADSLAVPQSLNWADDDDQTSAPLDFSAQDAAASSSASASIPALEAPITTSTDAASDDRTPPTGPSGRGRGRGGRGGRGRGSGPRFGADGQPIPTGPRRGGFGGEGRGHGRPQGQRQGSGPVSAQQPQADARGNVVDEDGFQTRVRTGKFGAGQGQAQAQGQGQGFGGRGRGGFGQGEGRGGRGGRGRGGAGPRGGFQRTASGVASVQGSGAASPAPPAAPQA